jgi:aryl-alcohol dehydrogenase-like predicted oxidoreductase
MNLTNFITLGRSGLRVSPLCLGTMTFGTDRGWGAAESESREMFRRYIELGGNFLDTADAYTDGTSETMLGKFVREGNLRDRVVIGTKFTVLADPDNPTAMGNGRKNIHRALEGSLRRLGTDYIDVYWLHAWDTITPPEEVYETLSDLVREGKIRHYGLSDVPAWYATRLHSLAERDGRNRPISLQLEYSLIERNIEREHIPAAQEMGWGLCAWSPLGGGLLTGKYHQGGKAEGRMESQKDNPLLSHGNPRTPEIVAALVDVAKTVGRAPAQVALNWVVTQPGVTSVIIGATRMIQFEDNLGAIDLALPAELRARLDAASAIELVHPYDFFQMPRAVLARGRTQTRRWRPA